MAYAFVKDNTAVEVVAANPHILFVPGYAAQFIEVPEDVRPGWRFSNNQWHAPDPVYPSKAELIADIDKRADAMRISVVGDPVRVEEYRLAREEAAKYIADGYPIYVPQTVQAWATAKNWTAKQAADDIAATAAQWEAVLYAVRTIRLVGKESVRAASDGESAVNAHALVIAQLAALGQ